MFNHLGRKTRCNFRFAICSFNFRNILYEADILALDQARAFTVTIGTFKIVNIKLLSDFHPTIGKVALLGEKSGQGHVFRLSL